MKFSLSKSVVLNLLTWITMSTVAYAQTEEAVSVPTAAPSSLSGGLQGGTAYSFKKFVSLDTELSLEYRSDRLREQQNNETTNIRNLSILADLFEEEHSGFIFEILGEEDEIGDLNVNVGKLYYHTDLSILGDHDSQFRVGIMKLGYGILNEIDGLFSVLPSYYSYLYDLPRGLDTGVSFSTQVFTKELILTTSLYAGKNLRQTDSKNREIDVLPHHFKLSWEPKKTTHLGLNYFSRKYEGQPLVSGYGLEYHHLSLANLWGFNLDLEMEAWMIDASLNSVDNNGLTALLAPKLTFKKLFFQPYLAMERWSQDGTSANTEVYFTGKLGYAFNKNFQFVVEQTQIQNRDTDIYKEDSFQARVVSQWQF